MPITIEIPTAFRRFTMYGAPKVDCTATTVADALKRNPPRAFQIYRVTSATTPARSANSSISTSTRKTFVF